MSDAVSILSRWPSRQALADDTGRNIVTIHSWFGRKSIPADLDVTLVSAAKRRGISLTFEELARTRAACPVSEPRPERETGASDTPEPLSKAS